MRTALYWFSRWPWLTTAVAFFVIAAMLPPFIWWVRTPLLLGLTLVAFIVVWGIKTNIAHRIFMENLIATVEANDGAETS
jgi:hypothetical protein